MLYNHNKVTTKVLTVTNLVNATLTIIADSNVYTNQLQECDDTYSVITILQEKAVICILP